MSEVINGYDIDILARSLFDSRRLWPQPSTDEEWAVHAERFPSTHRMLVEEARRIAGTASNSNLRRNT